jgi:YHS domain-containing protein
MKKLVLSILLILPMIIPVTANAEWKSIDGKWYYTEGNDYVKGWKNINGNWYYFSEPDGDIILGGIDQVNGKIYYFDNNGAMKTGWIYLKNNGSNYIGWHLYHFLFVELYQVHFLMC